MAREASSEAGRKILTESQGVEMQGDKVKYENSRQQMQTVHRGCLCTARQELLKRSQERRRI